MVRTVVIEVDETLLDLTEAQPAVTGAEALPACLSGRR